MRLEPGYALGLAASKARFAFPGLVIAPAHEAGAPFHPAVKAVPAPIRIAAHVSHLTLRQIHQSRIAGAGPVYKLHAAQILGISHIRGTAAKQQRLVAPGGDIDLVHLIFIRGEKLRRKGGNLGVHKLHMEDVVFIGDFLAGRFPGFRVGAGFGAVADFHLLGQCQDILEVKDPL